MAKIQKREYFRSIPQYFDLLDKVKIINCRHRNKYFEVISISTSKLREN